MQKNYKNAVVWSQLNCIACNSAKQLLNASGYIVDERIVGEGGTYTKQELLKQIPTARTLPQIFLDGEYVGDFKDLRKFLANR